MAQLYGRQVSLITKHNVRYFGTLHRVDEAAASIELHMGETLTFLLLFLSGGADSLRASALVRD